MALRLIGTPLEQQDWDNTLRRESLTRDIYQDFSGTFSDDKQALPNGIIAKKTLTSGSTKGTQGIILNLSGEETVGREEQLGRSEDQETKELDVFSNDVSHAVNTERYGIDAHSKKAYGILELVQPQISLYHKELKGKYIREAFLERYSSNLLVAPTSLTQRWNENIFIKGVTFAAQPAYDSNNTTYETQITAAATAGSGGQWDVTFLNALNHWITAIKKIEPMDNGRYIVTVPSRQSMFLKDPGAANSIAGLFKDSNVETAATNAYKWYLGSYGVMDLYEDPRSAVVNVNGSSLTSFYKGPGRQDDRYTAVGGTDYDVGMVHGKGGAVEAMHEIMHFEEEIQNFSKLVSVGGFVGYGMNRTVFDDIGAESDTSEINQNSAVILARTSLAAV
tara:strand:- start:21304 stop:22479 length:1176 start_codon:yes stop_codon:yes gene_type:complete